MPISSLIYLILFSSFLLISVKSQCPWSHDLTDLHSDCVCAYSNVQKLSIQCSPVNFTRLVEALRANVTSTPIDLLYVNNASAIGDLTEATFAGLDITNLHISRSRLTSIEPKTFSGLEDKLVKLSLPDNLLTEIPVGALDRLISLKTLDLSVNNITSLPDNAFATNQLTTLKLADNRLTNISDKAFSGLEPHLKHLNLKGTGISIIPKAIENLTALAFLDLAQNRIETLGPHQFDNLQTLTALSLERNMISSIDDIAFLGINDSLSSLSLLNNHIKTFPSQALSSLTELRVLDLGFNGIESIPNNGFHKNTLLTLLALDGNPLKTLPFEPFKHLNSTLRGLSLGGKSLVCDCQLSWILQWIRRYDLQVSSRERHPQFCGQPGRLRSRNLVQLSDEDLACENESNKSSSISPINSEPSSTVNIASSSTTTTTTTMATAATVTSTAASPQINSGLSKSSRRLPSDWPSDENSADAFDSRYPDNNNNFVGSSVNDLNTPINNLLTVPSASSQTISTASNPFSVKAASSSNESDIKPDIRLLAAYRRESSIILEWDTLLEESNNGFQILYRFFGAKEFKKGPKLGKSTRRYVLPHVPSGECIIVCVLPVDGFRSLSTEDVPSSLCQEIRRDRTKIADLDKLVIGVTAAICAFVVIAVIVFTCCYGKDKKKSLPSLPPPMAGPMKPDNEWETVSMYSARSIPRARMYHLDGSAAGPHPGGLNGSLHNIPMHDDNRSHISNYSHVPNGYMSKGRPTGDGQSHRSYSGLSNGRFGNGTCTLPHSDLSKAQLASVHPGATAVAYHNGVSTGPGHHLNSANKKKSKSCNRLNSTSSLHSLTEYDSDQWANGPMMGKMINSNGPNGPGGGGGWKDNQVDVYVGKNQLLANPMNGKYR